MASIGAIKSISVVLEDKRHKDLTVSGMFVGLHAKSFSEMKPVIKILIGEGNVVDFDSLNYCIKEIETKYNTTTITKFFNETSENQYDSLKRLAKLFLELQDAGVTTDTGDIMYNYD